MTVASRIVSCRCGWEVDVSDQDSDTIAEIVKLHTAFSHPQWYSCVTLAWPQVN